MNDHDAAQTVESGLTWGDVTAEERAELDEVFGPEDGPPDDVPPPPPVSMPYTFYGVPLCPGGEDGDMVLLLGHPEPLRAVAAINRYYRRLGFPNMLDEVWPELADLAGTFGYRWAVRRTWCGDCSGFVAGCTECAELATDDGWQLDLHDWQVPGGFPVVVWDG